MTTITTQWDRKMTVEQAPQPDRLLLTVERLDSGETIRAALTADHARTLAAALSPAQAGPWTRADLPAPPAIRCVDDDTALDIIVTHLNAHHPKPEPYDQGGVRGAHRLMYRAERERDAAVARAEQAERERDQAGEACALFQRDMHKWRERAEAAEARTAPAVTRAEVEKAIKGELVGSNVTLPDDLFELQIDAVCDLFGVEAEAVVDPVEAKAQELWEVVKPSAGATWSGTGELAKEQFRRVAAHVLGQEAER